ADRALDAEAADQVVHAVDAAQHRALAAAGRPDERRHRVPRDRQVRVAHRLEFAVVQRPQADVHHGVVAVAQVAGGGRAVRDLLVVHHSGTYFLAERAGHSCAATWASSTRNTRTSEAAHAISIWFRNGELEKSKINTASDGVGSIGLRVSQ